MTQALLDQIPHRGARTAGYNVVFRLRNRLYRLVERFDARALEPLDRRAERWIRETSDPNSQWSRRHREARAALVRQRDARAKPL